MNTSIKVLAATLAVAAAFGTVHVASAGRKDVYEVWVSPAQRRANGAFGDARNSADNVQNITVTLFAMTNYKSATVAFRNASNVLGTCTTTDPAIIDVLQSVSSDSQLDVQWNEQGQCTFVNVYTSSSRSVKAP